MSIQFGRWNPDEQIVEPAYLQQVRSCLAPYAPDSLTVCDRGSWFLLHGAFHTTSDSRRERQPRLLPGGARLIWTGRLDNRAELLGEANLPAGATDLEIVASSYEKEGTGAFARWIGDWSFGSFDALGRKLILAVDFLGVRPLYYLRTDRSVLWSSLLEPLVVLAGRPFALSEQYLAGWLCGFPAADLTPYREIRAVPPGSFLEIDEQSAGIRRYWEFRPGKHNPCSTDGEYEEGFRHYFTQAVRRRLRSERPVVSELSGGLDSSSIVCVADRILQNEPGLAPRLDTLSYLDDTEPDWDERPFLSEIEQHRGRRGCHIDVSRPILFVSEPSRDRFPATPALALSPSLPQQEVCRFLQTEGIRVVLSGLGGDETTGGVPDGTPELADLLVQARFANLFRKSLAWCLADRRPMIQLFAGLAGTFLPGMRFGPASVLRKVRWLNQEFAKRHQDNPEFRPLKLRLRKGLPSFQENLFALEELRRQIACAPVPLSPLRERRYPFLDRDLLEFLYSVPREQLVRPGRRRCLLRRALDGIVPRAVLERKRKGYVTRAPLKSFQAQSELLLEWSKSLRCAEIGAIDSDRFRAELASALQGDDSQLWRFSRALELETWLRDRRIRPLLGPVRSGESPADHRTSPALLRKLQS